MTLEELVNERTALLAALPSHTMRHDPRVHRLQTINTAIELRDYETYRQRVQACPHCSTEIAPDDCI